MYGTVMIGKLKTPSPDALVAVLEAWERDRKAPGHLDTRLLIAEQGKVVMAVRFESRGSYEELADSPSQDEWWNASVRPLLADEPVWIDGDWCDLRVSELEPGTGATERGASEAPMSRSRGLVERSTEVRDWFLALDDTDTARVRFHVDRLAELGPALDEPHTRQLDGKLRELRFYLAGRPTRLT